MSCVLLNHALWLRQSADEWGSLSKKSVEERQGGQGKPVSGHALALFGEVSFRTSDSRICVRAQERHNLDQTGY